MKILEVNKLYHPHIGGVESIVKQIAEGLNARNDADKNADNRRSDSDSMNVDVLCCNKKGTGRIDRVNGIRVKRTGSWGIYWGMPLSPTFFWQFRKEASKADVVDIHLPFPLASLALLFCFSLEAKIIVHYHSDIVRQKALNSFVNPLTKYTLKRANKIVISSPKLKESSPLLQNFQDKCEVIPFGIDVEEFDSQIDPQKQKEIKEKYGKFVLFVGRLNYYKGTEYLIDAMKNIDANLVIIGQGPELSKVKSQRSKVKLLPHQDKKTLINFYAAANVFVLPSCYKTEAFGIVLLEAMAQGTPVVTTEIGTGTSWVNQNKKTGLVVKPRDCQALAKAINKILNNPQLAKTLSKNACKRVKNYFTQEKMLSQTAAVFRDVEI